MRKQTALLDTVGEHFVNVYSAVIAFCQFGGLYCGYLRKPGVFYQRQTSDPHQQLEGRYPADGSTCSYPKRRITHMLFVYPLFCCAINSRTVYICKLVTHTFCPEKVNFSKLSNRLADLKIQKI